MQVAHCLIAGNTLLKLVSTWWELGQDLGYFEPTEGPVIGIMIFMMALLKKLSLPSVD